MAKGLNRIVRGFSLALHYFSGVSVILLMLVMSYEVFARYLFNSPTIWADEMATYLQVGIVFLAAAYVLRQGGHINIDIVYKFLPKRLQKVWLSFIYFLACCFLTAATYWSYKFVIHSFNTGATAWTLVQTPLFIPQMVFPLGMTALTLEAIVRFITYVAAVDAKPASTEAPAIVER